MDPRSIAALRANAGAPAPQSKTRWENGRLVLVNQPKTRGRGGFLSSLISETAGTGGMLGGAAAGAAAGSVVPGIGTLVGGVLGAGLGGFLGGTGGRVVENKVRDNRIGLGDALKEGALSGAIGAAGTGLQVARGLKAAGGLAGIDAAVAGGGENALSDAAKSIVMGGKKAGVALAGQDANTLAQRGSGRLFEKSAGLKLGSGVGNVADNQLASDVYLKNGLTGTPRQILQKTPTVMSQLDSKVTSILANTDTKLTGSDVVKSIQQMAKNPSNFSELELNNPAAKKALQLHLDQIAKIGNDPVAINDYVKSLNPVATKAREALYAGRTLTSKQTAALAVKEGIDNSIGEVSAEVRPLKQAMAVMFKRTPEIADAANKGASLPFGAGRVPGAKLVAEGIRGAGSRTAGLVNGTSSLVPQGVGTLTRGVAARGIANQLTAPKPPDQFGQDSTYDTSQQPSLYTQAPSPQGGLSNALGQGSNPPPQSLYPLEAALRDIQRDPKNTSTYLNIYKAAQSDMTAVQKQQPKLSAAQQTRKDVLASALGSLDTVGQTLPESGGAKGLRGEVGKIPWAGKFFDPQGAAYTNTKIELATQLAKAITGGSRAPESVINRYLHSLPDINDTPAYAQAKLDKLRQELYGQARRFGWSDLIDDGQSSYNQLNSQAGGQDISSLFQAIGGY